MLILISPSKTMDLSIPNSEPHTQSRYLDKTSDIMKVLMSKSKNGIIKMMNMSSAIAEKTLLEYQILSQDHNLENSQRALFAYSGAVFIGVDPGSLSKNEISFGQSHMRILSGLYGVLRPLDLVQRYRLEMHAKIKVKRKNLYAFWKSEVTQSIIEDAKNTNSDLIVNLLSNEYSKLLDTKMINCPIVEIGFKMNKNGVLKFLSYDAKKARGMMCRYLIKKKAKSIDDIKKFSVDGYSYEQTLSTEQHLLFVKKM